MNNEYAPKSVFESTRKELLSTGFVDNKTTLDAGNLNLILNGICVNNNNINILEDSIDEIDAELQTKQDTLEAGDGITINGNTISCVGSNNYIDLLNKPEINGVELTGDKSLVELGIQGTLVSGTNIKTINGESVLGSGDIVIQGDSSTVDLVYNPTSENAQSGKAVAEAISSKQDTLNSGTNIKTINGISILGPGNIVIEGGGSGSGSGGSNIIMYEKELTDGTTDYITIIPRYENPLSIKATINLTTDTFELNDTICMSVNGNEYVLGDAIDTRDLFGYIEISNKIVRFDIAGINSGYSRIDESDISEVQFYTSGKRIIRGSCVIKEAYSNDTLFDDTSAGLKITVIGG